MSPIRLFFHKLTHWEYWPFQILYIPAAFQWIWYSLKTGTIFFFNAANPTIKNGGFMSESKMEIYDLIPQKYFPATILVKEGMEIDKIAEMLLSSGINFPIIAKPDIGLRGSAVKKIVSTEQLQAYASKARFDFLLQDVIPYPNEIGVFYIRYPNQEKGRITGIVAKEFLIVTGDGKSTIKELLKKDPRHAMQFEALRKEYGEKMHEIPGNGVKLNLMPFGNHVRGAKFIDASHWNSPELENIINEICLQVEGFYFGRLDIMYERLEDLCNGKNFLLVEINGTGSVPTHIYDPKHSVFFACRELMCHIRYMYEIGEQNHKKGVPYLSYREGMEQFRIHNKVIANFEDF